MLVTKKQDVCLCCDAVILPFAGSAALSVELPKNLAEAVKAAVDQEKFSGECGSLYTMNLLGENGILSLVLIGLGDENASNREAYLAFCKALKYCKDQHCGKTVVYLDNAAARLENNPALVAKLCECPWLVSYDFTAYKSNPAAPAMEQVEFVTQLPDFQAQLDEAAVVAQCTLHSRDLVNHPSRFMTPAQLGVEAQKLAQEYGLDCKVFDKPQIEALGMDTFLAVGRGAVDEPRLVVLRYMGASADQETIGLVGKGIMFDSGGYSLKSKMATMHDDMGGAAAVIGAITALARRKVPVNVVAVVAACKNMISGDAYVPGDILRSMSGKTIEMLNADAEGRLTLADAITYAIREEKVDRVIDIATLTGAAKGAVGGRTAPILSNDDAFCGVMEQASKVSCEKVWRLNADKELRPVLNSAVADIKNSSPGNNYGGGTIVAGLFIQEFVEGKPWIHVDMAPVNWLGEDSSYCCKGATGYGVSLLYQTVKLLAK